MNLIAPITNFVKKSFNTVVAVVNYAIDEIVSFAKGLVKHIESVAILSLASIGLTFLLSEIPFYITLPMWVESPMFIPVVAGLIIWALVKSAERRHAT